MKLKLLTAAAAAAMMVVPTVAQAQDYDDKGWYLRGNVGYGVHTDIDHSGIITGDTESEGNAAYTVGAGYDFGNNWRVELDHASLWTDMGQVSQAFNTYSKLRTNTLMINALYDFDEFGNWEPYVGAGIGKMRANASTESHGFFDTTGLVYNQNPTCVANAACQVRDRDNAWAWQLMAGLGYDVSDRLVWDTQYRYQKSFEDLGFDGTTTSTGFTPDGTGLMWMEDVGAHMLTTGLRYKLSSPAPMVTCWNGDSVKMIGDCPAAPVIVTCWDGSSFEEGSGKSCPDRPVRTVEYETCWDGTQVERGVGSCPLPPAPEFTCWNGDIVSDMAFCPAQVTERGNVIADLCANEYRQEIIYYEFDKGQSAETRATINRILDIGDYCQVENISVVGHTDTSGSAAYNLALSERRAKDAMDELVRQGINRATISSSGMGETQPFVPTGDGVKEQLNRRTEVLIKLIQAGAYSTN